MRRRRNIPPTEEVRGKVYYHGTPFYDWAKRIIRTGEIRPQDMVGVKSDADPAYLESVRGKVYVTPYREWALVFAKGFLGGLSPIELSKRRFGYLFEIPGDQFVDVEPDQDDVFFWAVAGLNPKNSEKQIVRIARHYFSVRNAKEKDLKAVARVARRVLTKKEVSNLTDHYTEDPTTMKLAKSLPRGLKERMLEAGASVAHTGPLKFSKAWRFSLGHPLDSVDEWWPKYAKRVANPSDLSVDALKRRLLS
jgi:hypothetical protein